MSQPTQSELDRWADAFDAVWSDPRIVPDMRCPSCSVAGELHFLYVLDENDPFHGMFAFWCAACMTGLPPGIGSVPKGADSIRRGQENIPNYRLAIDT